MRAHEVEFVLIGGFALGFHRAARDEGGTVGRAAGSGDFLPEEMPVEWGLEASSKAAGTGSCIRFGRLDLMRWVDPFDSCEELRANAVEEYVDEIGASLLVVGLEDLIAMKQVAGRDQDRLDITALRMAHGLEE